ncbi:magnesium transporter CorA family protein [Mesorhizobium sp. STM 4661]|uniref:magnesium transporter CorA family protein n=1 Tax=Mesorhizobium sp. STM 4661 TaxID=1297570 RepID=UPI0002BF8C4A|nr:magnesium transporter CorA family protein [Mesorhizobium sp. STM 4661]CCV11342.1 Mg2 transporter protein CorA family protein [Mesorhizobium sp. STM 4661]
MIQAYSVNDHTLVCTPLSAGAALPPNTIWIDMFEPTVEEDSHVESLAGVSIPTRDEMRSIEDSSRLYSENHALYLTVPVLFAAGADTPGIAPVTFVATQEHLVTVRYSQPLPFTLYAARAAKAGNDLVFEKCDPLTIFFGLIESVTDRIAELLENVAQRLDAESTRLISGSGIEKPISTKEFRAGLKLIAKEGDFLSKIRESLAGFGRLLAYLQSSSAVTTDHPSHTTWLKSLERDVQSLNDHLSYLAERTVFLLDTVVGLVSVEQNGIIKIFSVAAVVFLPPTLVASIYGMNFTHMPELEWLLGYPWAIGVMLLSAILPLFYFRSRGWL